jgi:Synergist-CTERM protein sorting domain-containing protein
VKIIFCEEEIDLFKNKRLIVSVIVVALALALAGSAFAAIYIEDDTLFATNLVSDGRPTKGYNASADRIYGYVYLSVEDTSELDTSFGGHTVFKLYNQEFNDPGDVEDAEEQLFAEIRATTPVESIDVQFTGGIAEYSFAKGGYSGVYTIIVFDMDGVPFGNSDLENPIVIEAAADTPAGGSPDTGTKPGTPPVTDDAAGENTSSSGCDAGFGVLAMLAAAAAVALRGRN